MSPVPPRPAFARRAREHTRRWAADEPRPPLEVSPSSDFVHASQTFQVAGNVGSDLEILYNDLIFER
jgi:hypothetical protein